MTNNTTDSNQLPKPKNQDILGIVLLLLGGFAAVSIFLAMRGRVSDSLLNAPVAGLSFVLGHAAGLVFALGIGSLGALMFLRDDTLEPGKHVLGVLGLGVGLSLLLGAYQASLGGAVGGAAAGLMGPLAGGILGGVLALVVLVASSWVAWFNSVSLGAPRALTGSARTAPQREESDGVSPEEAMALQPDKLEVPEPAAVVALPKDVRLHGGVPAGAMALGAEPMVQTADNPDDPFAVTLGEAQHGAAKEAFIEEASEWDANAELEEELAELEDELEEADLEPEALEDEELEPVAAFGDDFAPVASEGPSEVAELESDEEEYEEEDEELVAELEDADEEEEDEYDDEEDEDEEEDLEEESAEYEEDEEEYEEDEEDEDDVEEAAEYEDAYEDDELEELTSAEAEAAAVEERTRLAAASAWQKAEAEAQARIEKEQAARLEAEAAAQKAEQEARALAEAKAAAAEEVARLEAEAAAQKAEEEAAALAEAEAAAAAKEAARLEAEAAAQKAEEEALALAKAEAAAAEEAARLEAEAAEQKAEEEVRALAAAAKAEPKNKAKSVKAKKPKRAPKAAPAEEAPAQQAGLFAEVPAEDLPGDFVLTPAAKPKKKAGAKVEPVKAKAEDKAPELGGNPEQPKVSRRKAKADAKAKAKAAKGTVEVSLEVILGAGELVVEENRVAVSMVQRRFELSFDEACVVLDKLQDLGLIGPYVGGRNREILLGAEDWQARASELSQA